MDGAIYIIIVIILIVVVRVIPYLGQANERAARRERQERKDEVWQKFASLKRERQEQKEEAWEKFARLNKLAFTPGQFRSGEAQVTGNYRGHALKLKTTTQNETPFTRLTVRQNKAISRQELEQSDYPPGRLTPQMVSKVLTAKNSAYTSGRLETTANGQTISYSESGRLDDLYKLQDIAELLSNLATGYLVLLTLGGKAMPGLQPIAADADHPLHKIARQLVRDIARTTTRELASQSRQLLCAYCLVRYSRHGYLFPGWQSVTYYGCRICGQSRAYFEAPLVVASLDEGASAEIAQEGEIVRVNWLTRRQLFDFNMVEIIAADDEAVERFAIQVGNDTNERREPNYQKWYCIISPQCQLSENTQRILRHTFGHVKVGTVEATVAASLGYLM